MSLISVRLQIGDKVYKENIDTSRYSDECDISQYIKEELIRKIDILSPFHHIVLFDKSNVINSSTEISKLDSIFGLVDPINIIPTNQRGLDYINSSKWIYNECIDESLYMHIKKESMKKDLIMLTYNDFDGAAIIRKDNSTNNSKLVSLPIPRYQKNVLVIFEQFNYSFTIPFTNKSSEILNAIRRETKLEIELKDFKARLDLERSEPIIIIKLKSKESKIKFANISSEINIRVPKYINLGYISKQIESQFQNSLHKNEVIIVEQTNEKSVHNVNQDVFFKFNSEEKFIITTNLRTETKDIENIFKVKHKIKSTYQLVRNGIKKDPAIIPHNIKTIKELVKYIKSKPAYGSINIDPIVKLNGIIILNDQDINHNNQLYEILFNEIVQPKKPNTNTETEQPKETPPKPESSPKPEKPPKEEPILSHNKNVSKIPIGFKFPSEIYLEERSKALRDADELYNIVISKLAFSVAWKLKKNNDSTIFILNEAKKYDSNNSILDEHIDEILLNTIQDYCPNKYEENILQNAKSKVYQTNDLEAGINLIREKLQIQLKNLLESYSEDNMCELVRDIINREGLGYNLIKEYSAEEIREAFKNYCL